MQSALHPTGQPAIILPFPAPPRLPPIATPAPLARAAASMIFIGLGEVARMFAIHDRRDRSQIQYVRDQIAQKGFPMPVHDRRWRGKLLGGAASVCKAAKWRRIAVETWFDNALPPTERLAGESLRQEATRAALASTAARLAAPSRRAA